MSLRLAGAAAARLMGATRSPTITGWNVADYDAGVPKSAVFANNDTVVYLRTSNAGVRATQARSSGKRYFEGLLFYTSYATTSSGFGVCNLSQALVVSGGAVGNTTNSIGYRLNGQIAYNGSALATGAAATTGRIFCFAVDLDARLFWARIGGENWNGDALADPATGVGGLAMAGGLATGDLYPYCAFTTGVSFNGLPAVFLQRELMSFAIPSGFTAWAGDAGGGMQVYSERTQAVRQASFFDDVLSDEVLDHVETFVSAISSGTWAKIDVLMLPCLPSAGAGMLNLKTNALTILGDRGMPHARGEGFGVPNKSSSGSDGFFTIGNENSFANYVQNSAHMAVWPTRVPYYTGFVTFEAGNTSNVHIGSSTDGSFVARTNAAAADTVTGMDYSGHCMWNRTGSGAVDFYRNGAVYSSSTRASVALTTASIRFMQVGGGGGWSGYFPIAAFHMGGALTGAEAIEIYNAISTLVTAMAAYAEPSLPTPAISRWTNHRQTGAAITTEQIEAAVLQVGGQNFPNPIAQMTLDGELMIPADVKFYRFLAQWDLSGLTVPPPAYVFLARNRITGFYPQFTTQLKPAASGGTAEYTCVGQTGIIRRMRYGAESVRWAFNGFINPSQSTPDSENTHMVIEVLERW